MKTASTLCCVAPQVLLGALPALEQEQDRDQVLHVLDLAAQLVNGVCKQAPRLSGSARAATRAEVSVTCSQSVLAPLPKTKTR